MRASQQPESPSPGSALAIEEIGIPSAKSSLVSFTFSVQASATNVKQLVDLDSPIQAAFNGIVEQWNIKAASGGSPAAQESGQEASAGNPKTPKKPHKRHADDDQNTPSRRSGKRSKKDRDDDEDPSAFRPQTRPIGFHKFERFAGTPCIGVYAGFKYPFYKYNPDNVIKPYDIPKVLNPNISVWWPKQKKIDVLAQFGPAIPETIAYIDKNGQKLTKMKQETAREILGHPLPNSMDRYMFYWFFKNEQIKSAGATKDNNWTVNASFDRAMRSLIRGVFNFAKFYHVWTRGISGGVANLSVDDGSLFVYMALLAVGTEYAKRWREHLGDEQGFMFWMNEAFIRSKASATSTASLTRHPNLYSGLLSRLEDSSREACNMDCTQIETSEEYKSSYELIILFGETYKNGTLHTASYFNPRICKENNISMDEGMEVRAEIEADRIANMHDIEHTGAVRLTYDQLEAAALAKFLAKTDMSSRGMNWPIFTDADRALMKIISPVDITEYKDKPLVTNMASGSRSKVGGVTLDEIKLEITKAQSIQTPLIVDAVIHKLEQKIYPYLTGLLADSVRNTVGHLKVGFPGPGRFIVGSMEMGDIALRLKFAHVADSSHDDPPKFLRHLILGYIPVEKTRAIGLNPGHPGRPEPSGSNHEPAGSNQEPAGSSSEHPVVISSAGTEKSPHAELVLILLTCSWATYTQKPGYLLSESATVTFCGCSIGAATTWMSETAVSSVVATVIKLHRLLLPADLAEMIVACSGPNFSVNLSAVDHSKLRDYLVDAFRQPPEITPLTNEQNELFAELHEDLLKYRRFMKEKIEEAKKRKEHEAIVKRELELGRIWNPETRQFEEDTSGSDAPMRNTIVLESDDDDNTGDKEDKSAELEDTVDPVKAAQDAAQELAELVREEEEIKKAAELEAKKIQDQEADLERQRAIAKKEQEEADAKAEQLRKQREASTKSASAISLEERRLILQQKIEVLKQQKLSKEKETADKGESADKGKAVDKGKGKGRAKDSKEVDKLEEYKFYQEEESVESVSDDE